MTPKLKPRKCRLRSCGVVFQPVTEWQKFHKVRCRNAFEYRARTKLIREAQRNRAAQQRGVV